MKKLPISIIIPAKNESKNIVECLESLGWADEIFVVDSQSNDDTVAKAESFGVHVVQFNYGGGWPKKKNWAINNLPFRNEWIMIVDADERVTPELRDEIAEAISQATVNGFYIRWKFMFLGRWMKNCWNHGWMLRLFRKGMGEYENLGLTNEGGWDNEVHENLYVRGEYKKLQNYMLHESRQDLSYWLAKHNQFSDWEVKRNRILKRQTITNPFSLLKASPAEKRKWLRVLFLKMPMQPLLMFVYLFVFKRGFLDGRAGYYFCRLMAWYFFIINVKTYEDSLKPVA